MITHKDSLQNKVKQLQKLIDELSELNIGGINIKGGVIVDMTVDSINTQNITSNNANITESLTTKNITSYKANITSLLTTSNINNSNSIASQRIVVSDYMRIYGSSSYVNMNFNGRLYIDESVYLRSNKFFFQNNVTYLFDTNATLYFSRERDNVLHGTNTFKCVAYGFYNQSNGYALISTGFVLTPLGDSQNDWGVLLGFVVNGITLNCIYYDGLGTNGNEYTASIPGNTGNNPLTPPIMGNMETFGVTNTIYKNRIDVDRRYYNSLFCYANKMSLNGTTKAVYVVSNTDSEVFEVGAENLGVKFTDVLMQKG